MSSTSTTPRPTTAPRKKKSHWRKIIPYTIGAALIGWIIIGLLPKPLEIEVTAVRRKPMTVSVVEEGRTRIRHRYVISPPVAGYLERVPLRAGATVEAGKTVLATLQPTPSSLLDPRTKAHAEAMVKAAEAAREQRSELIKSAEAERELASKEWQRAQDLHGRNAIALRDFDTARSRFQTSASQWRAAQFALQVAEFDLQQAKATLEHASGEVPSGGERLELRAPVDGVVLKIFEESARQIAPGQPVMEIGDPRDLEAEIELLSSDAVRVKPGAKVIFEQWGGSTPLTGRVVMVEPGGFLKISALGVEEQRVLVRVDFDELPQEGLGDRFRVEARIVTWQGEEVLQIPTGALFRKGNQWMTFVNDGNRARVAEVGIAHSNGIDAEVISGVREGEQVLLHPPENVREGIAILPRLVE